MTATLTAEVRTSCETGRTSVWVFGVTGVLLDRKLNVKEATAVDFLAGFDVPADAIDAKTI